MGAAYDQHLCTCAEYQPNGADPISASAVAISKGTVTTPSGNAYPFPVPRALEISEIPGVVKSYADGARNSLAAGMLSTDYFTWTRLGPVMLHFRGHD